MSLCPLHFFAANLTILFSCGVLTRWPTASRLATQHSQPCAPWVHRQGHAPFARLAPRQAGPTGYPPPTPAAARAGPSRAARAAAATQPSAPAAAPPRRAGARAGAAHGLGSGDEGDAGGDAAAVGGVLVGEEALQTVLLVRDPVPARPGPARPCRKAGLRVRGAKTPPPPRNTTTTNCRPKKKLLALARNHFRPMSTSVHQHISPTRRIHIFCWQL